MSSKVENVKNQPISIMIYCIANGMRRLIIQRLADVPVSFTELMGLCGLSSRYDTTGTFTYHLSQLTRLGLVEKSEDLYELTPIGRKANQIVGLLERESNFLGDETKEDLKVGGEDVVIRQAKFEDKGTVAELVASEYFEEASKKFQVPREYYERRKKETDFTLGISGRNLVFLAKNQDQVCGVCWWTIIEREAVDGKVNKEAFLEHLYVKTREDYESIADQLMRTSIPILLEDEKTTILNVWHGKNETLEEKFYERYDIKKPEDLDLLMMVADWAKPTWKPKSNA